MKVPSPIAPALLLALVVGAPKAAAPTIASPRLYTVPGARDALPVFARRQVVTANVEAWRVLDSSGRLLARGGRGGRLPTGRYGTFRLVTTDGRQTSFAVVPDVAAGQLDRLSPFATSGDLSSSGAQANLPRAAAMLHRMGAVASRVGIRWELVQPGAGSWSWEQIDRVMIAQHAAGIEPLGLLDSGGAIVKNRSEPPSDSPEVAEETINAFAGFCRAAVRRYRPGGTLARRMDWKGGWGVRHWEFRYEMTTDRAGSPERYGRLFRAARAAINAEQADAVVHFPSVGAEWDARTLHVAGVESFEGVTSHALSSPRSPDEADLAGEMRETVRWFRQRGLRSNLWVSGVGWDTTMQSTQETRQANYLVRAYAIALDAGMDRVLWRSFRDDGPPASSGRNSGFGVVRPDLSPRPSYAAYAAMVSRLAGKRPAGRAHPAGGATAILFAHRAGPTAVVWVDGRHGSLAPIPGANWRDLMGNPGSGRIPLGDSPVYVIAPGKSVAWLRRRLESSAIAGIPPVDLRMLQIIRNGQAHMRVRVRNLTRRPMDGVLAWTGQGFGPSVSVALRSGQARELEVPVGTPFRRIGGQQYAGVRFRFQAPGPAKVPHEVLATGLVPDPVIPRSVGEAPTMEEFWATAPAYRLNMPRYVVGLLPWSEKDLSAEVRFLHDGTGLWIRILVTDDVFHQPHTGQDIRKADSVLVAISGNDRKVAHEFAYALTSEGPRAARVGAEGGERGGDDAGSVDARRAGNSVTYDIRIPWAELSPLTGRAGERFRMNVMINENDGYGPRGWLEFSPGIGARNTPARWLVWTLD